MRDMKGNFPRLLLMSWPGERKANKAVERGPSNCVDVGVEQNSATRMDELEPKKTYNGGAVALVDVFIVVETKEIKSRTRRRAFSLVQSLVKSLQFMACDL